MQKSACVPMRQRPWSAVAAASSIVSGQKLASSWAFRLPHAGPTGFKSWPRLLYELL
jgi:hypothetical protein